MDAAIVSLIIIMIGAIFLIIEALSPGAFMVIPGTVLIIIGIIGYAAQGFLFSIYSPITAVIIAIPITLITIRFYRLLAKPIPPTTQASDSLIGKKGEVVVATEPNTLKGKVRLGMEIWSADSEKPIEKGVRVEVISTEGVHVTVRIIGDATE